MTAASDAADKLCDQLQAHPDPGYALTLFLTAHLLSKRVLTVNDLVWLANTFARPDHVSTARAEFAKALAAVGG